VTDPSEQDDCVRMERVSARGHVEKFCVTCRDVAEADVRGQRRDQHFAFKGLADVTGRANRLSTEFRVVDEVD
jgi:hypothetical protein